LIVDFIDRHKKKFGVEPICAQLEALGCKFAPSSYYEARSRRPSARALRDEDLKKQIIAEYEENYRCCGARTMWLQLRGKGIDVARCTVERLMKVLGLQGVAGRSPAGRSSAPRPEPGAPWAKDLVGRN